jgi:hypothetical protein
VPSGRLRSRKTTSGLPSRTTRASSSPPASPATRWRRTRSGEWPTPLRSTRPTPQRRSRYAHCQNKKAACQDRRAGIGLPGASCNGTVASDRVTMLCKPVSFPMVGVWQACAYCSRPVLDSSRKGLVCVYFLPHCQSRPGDSDRGSQHH